jgi:hypothetical protein
MHAEATYRWARLRVRAGDRRHATELLQRAAAMGHAGALFRVGLALLSGSGGLASSLNTADIGASTGTATSTGNGIGTGTISGTRTGTGTAASVSLTDPIRIGDRSKRASHTALGFECVARAARGGHIQVCARAYTVSDVSESG